MVLKAVRGRSSHEETKQEEEERLELTQKSLVGAKEYSFIEDMVNSVKCHPHRGTMKYRLINQCPKRVSHLPIMETFSHQKPFR